MAAFKSMVIAHQIVEAGKRRKCHHNRDHMILKGYKCLEIREGMGWKGYCIDCGLKMVGKAAQNLEALRRALESQIARQ